MYEFVRIESLLYCSINLKNNKGIWGKFCEETLVWCLGMVVDLVIFSENIMEKGFESVIKCERSGGK